MTDPLDPPPERLPSDGTLLARLQAGEHDAATELYKKYAQRLLRLAEKNKGEALNVRVDAEDIVQSVFRTFFRRASAGHYNIPAGDELWKLFLVMALNKIRTLRGFHFADKRNVSQTCSMETHDVADVSDSVTILQLTIDDVLQALSPSQQQVVRDRINGFEVDDIAKRNGVSRRSTERILQSFRQRLREAIGIDWGA